MVYANLVNDIIMSENFASKIFDSRGSAITLHMDILDAHMLPVVPIV